MKALICNSPGKFEYANLPDPEAKPDEIILRIRQVGICGTDFHAFEGNQPYFNYPRILGHELCATVADNNGQLKFKPGEEVTVLPYLNCGTCQACHSGKANCCTQLKVMGVHQDGGMCEYISVNPNFIVAGNELGTDALTIVEPLSIGAHAVSRANVQSRDLVLVIGAGPIGIGTAFFARKKGANVIIVDPIQSRLNFCSENLDLEGVIHGTTTDAQDHLMQRFKNRLPDIIFEATGNLAAVEGTLPLLAHGGTIVLVGLQKQNFSFNHPEFHKRETTLLSSRNAIREDFDCVLDSLRSGSFPTNKFITHRCAFNDLQENFNIWMSQRGEIIKAVASFD